MCFSGEPWYGNSLLKQLEGLHPEMAIFRIGRDSHNIIEIVTHITLWREFVVQKLKGNKEFNLAFNTIEEWPGFDTCSKEDLDKAIISLNENQKVLLIEIDKFEESDLTVTVPGRQYSFFYMLEGINQHDIYHSGQIGLIKSVYLKL